MTRADQSRIQWLALGFTGIPALVLALSIALLASCHPAYAEIPRASQIYKRTLIRAAHAHWGLDAPIATMAAQIHQESRWKVDARSPVGAEGLAQFMPATSDWFAQLYPQTLGERQPYSAGWSLQALVLYDHWLYRRLSASDNCERWAMVLASYNGGLGWVLRDKREASAGGADKLRWFNAVEHYNAGRSRAAFRENRDYPRKILLRWEPLYVRAYWGSGACTRGVPL
ncbi:transglycosylase SLT domain-containing protein [Microbulbifer sp. ANSA003]|uniref:transglycosylase SLT domain-containing protein n=1 Tax=Microbulbifer sp. ANSA003 TaxID=3243360 RepID=UPI004041B14B